MQVLESINIREREQETRLTVVSARPVSFSLSPPRSQVSGGVPGMRFSFFKDSNKIIKD